MKQFILGMVTVVVLGTISNIVWLKTEAGTLHRVAKFVNFDIISGEYLLNPIMGKCQDRNGQNGFGWKFNVADYYGCDRFQRLLNGNFKPKAESPTVR